MATPRIFVSSTCYDLQEIRFQLRNFISDFGYDAVMSEFDDIFYGYDRHVQDSCLDEISKCQLFILVIGNNYGSFYHQDKKEIRTPESVTLKEFRKALETKIPKHIFVNKYVDYDYKNYKRALDKKNLEYFTENEVPNNKSLEVKNQIKSDFDQTYPFPFDSYKYVFYFLEIVYELKYNNAINTFETFMDIKDSLRKQWAGFMYESLIRKDKNVASIIQPLETKIDKIEKNLSQLIDSKTEDDENKLSFDLKTLLREKNIDSLESQQNYISRLLHDITNYDYLDQYGYEITEMRIWFSEYFTAETARKWLDSLQILTQSYKWSKLIHCENVFANYPLRVPDNLISEISYRTIFELYTLYEALDEQDKNTFSLTVAEKLNRNYKEPPQRNINTDDIPF